MKWDLIWQKINHFDSQAVSSLNHFIVKHSNTVLDKIGAEYLIYLLPLILIILWFWSIQAKKVALKALFAAILAWPILAKIIAALVHRARPTTITGVKEVLFHRPDFSFPSDHAAALFAVAFSFWLSGYRRLAIFVFILALLISFFRVATAIHFPTDILAGAVLGLAAAYLIDLFDRPLSLVYGFLIRFFKILRLA